MAAACQALATAAAALQQVASALQGRPFVPSLPSLSLPPPPPPADDTVTVLDAVNLLLVSKAKVGRSDAYLRQLRMCFASFARGRSRTPLAAITAGELEGWLDQEGGSARTRKGRIQYLRLLFAFAQRRGFVASNPALALDVPAQSVEAPGIHSPAEVRAILEAARAWSPRLTRVLAIRYFAGLRAAEIARLDEADIGAEFITVPAHKAKTRQRRLVTIQPALRAWLALGGTLPGQTCEQQIWELSRRTGIPWPRNAPRHSFVSYHLAHFGSAARTALEAGHSEAMLFAHYRALVTPAHAAEFWSIRPGHK